MFQLPHDDDVLESVRTFINDQTYTYVEHSNDKVYIIARPEYCNLEGPGREPLHYTQGTVWTTEQRASLE
jgi:hypothetical protein